MYELVNLSRTSLWHGPRSLNDSINESDTEPSRAQNINSSGPNTDTSPLCTSNESTELARTSLPEAPSGENPATEAGTSGTPFGTPSFSVRGWFWEVTAISFSSCCLVAVVAVLLTVQGSAIAKWNLIASPNAILSAFSTLCKASLLSVVTSCLSQHKWIYFSTAAHRLLDFQTFDDASRGPWGALNLLWKLRMRPSLAAFGSLVTVIALAIDPFSQAVISLPVRDVVLQDRASLRVVRLYHDGYGLGGNAYDEMLNPRIKGSLLAELYSIDQPLPLNCDSGNCTWPEFTTLGICSECQNVTNQTRKSTRPGPLLSEYYIYTTPGNFSVWLTNSGRSDGTTLFNSTSSARQIGSTSANDVDQEGKLITFAFAKMENNSAHIEECEIRWCARTYINASVIRKSFNPGTITRHQLNHIGSTKITEIEDSTYEEFQIPQSDDSFSGNRSFFVNHYDHLNLEDFLSSTFTTDSGNDTGQVLSLLNSVPEKVNNITVSMSYSMGYSLNASEIRGDAMVQEVYFHVRWTWLSLPIAMVVLALILLVATMVSSSRKSVPRWKSTSMVPIFANLYGWDANELKNVSLTSIEQRSKSMRVIVNVSNDGRVDLIRS